MRISDQTNAVSLIENLSSTTKAAAASDLSWMTGTVSEIAKQKAAANATDASGVVSKNSSVAVNFSQAATELKQLNKQEALMQKSADTLTKMQSLASSDLSGKSDADKIAAGVQYSKLQRQLGDYSSKSLLSEASARAAATATTTKGKVDVIAVAVSSKLGSSGLADKLSAAQSFVDTSKTVVEDKIDTVKSEKKTLTSGMTSLYAAAQGVKSE